MIWLELAGVILVLCFSFVVIFGAPYLPTLTPQVATALELLDMKSGQTMLELGCGDGKILIAAAKQGINIVGYELNPLMALLAWLRTRRYRRQVRVIWGNFWCKPWPEADAIFTFLLPKHMKKLNNKIMQYQYKPVKLVSFAFRMPAKQTVAEKNNVYLYEYR